MKCLGLDKCQVLNFFLVENAIFSQKSFVGSENSRTFAPAFAQITGSEQIEKEFFERVT